MIRLFVEHDLSTGATAPLRPEQIHYLVNVMRQTEGDALHLFNGRDGEWTATLVEVRKKVWIARVDELAKPWLEGPDLELIVALVKRGRLETIVEKAAELGVRRVRLVMTERTNSSRVNLDRLRAIAMEAAEQTGRLDVPRLDEPVRLFDLLGHWNAEQGLLFCDESADAPPALLGLGQANFRPRWGVLIGPEGGFSPSERSRVRAMPESIPVSLGPRVLRADTAAIAALTLVQSTWGDWAAS